MKYAIPFLILAFFPAIAVRAAESVKIGAIQASGATADDEFIALENSTDQNIDIGNWSVQYKSAKGTSFYKKNFAKDTSVAPGETYVICGKGFIGACGMRHSSFSLSSDGGTVFIVSNQTLLASAADPAIIDQKIYSAESSGTNPPQSEPQTPSTASDMPPTNNKQPEAIILSINEFMPAPTMGDEWIELYNGNGSAIELDGWTLADGTGKNFLTLSGLIMPASFRVFNLPSARLNDAGDEIILRDADARESDRVCYGDWQCKDTPAPASAEGAALARIGDGRDTNDDGADFATTTLPTPGAANIISAPPNAPIPVKASVQKKQNAAKTADLQWLADLLKEKSGNLAEMLKADNVIIVNNLYISTGANTESSKPITETAANSKISAAAAKTTAAKSSTSPAKAIPTVSGRVIVPAGIMGADICVVREENRSVEVRLPKDLMEKPSAGDAIRASGSWSTAKTLVMPRLLVKSASSFSVTGHEEPPLPANITISAAEQRIGEIVSTQGTIVEKQPTRLRIADDNASLVIKTKFSAAKGDKLAVTGLLTADANDKYLTPLDPSGISLIKPPPEPAKSVARKALPYGLAAVPAVILSTAAYFGKKIKKKKDEDLKD